MIYTDTHTHVTAVYNNDFWGKVVAKVAHCWEFCFPENESRVIDL